LAQPWPQAEPAAQNIPTIIEGVKSLQEIARDTRIRRLREFEFHNVMRLSR
jgi:hypothetical protein